jgi:hypothetical protein
MGSRLRFQPTHPPLPRGLVLLWATTHGPHPPDTVPRLIPPPLTGPRAHSSGSPPFPAWSQTEAVGAALLSPRMAGVPWFVESIEANTSCEINILCHPLHSTPTTLLILSCRNSPEPRSLGPQCHGHGCPAGGVPAVETGGRHDSGGPITSPLRAPRGGGGWIGDPVKTSKLKPQKLD